MVIFPDEKTIAFGGVATGSMNAMDAEMVVGIMRSNGSRFRAMAVPFITGRRAAVVAVLDVNSVRNVMIMHTVITINSG